MFRLAIKILGAIAGKIVGRLIYFEAGLFSMVAGTSLIVKN
jgi:hypothetical protein